VKNNPLVASIKYKLLSLEEPNILTNNIIKSHMAKLVSNINLAIESNTRIIIRKYQSANTESISDRLVEPIGFTSNYQFMCGFEVSSMQNKYFKLERMGSIENLTELTKFKELHELLTSDVFGFNESGKKFNVNIQMSMRAMLFLKDDYPATADFLLKQNDGTWLLSVEVNSMEPVKRILRSMPDEIKIIENK
jgi:hypothetical protein